MIFVLYCFLTLPFMACNKNNGNLVSPNTGKWKLTYFWDKEDETNYYTNYTFDFGSNGALTASKNGQNWAGTWQTGIDDSKEKIILDFNGSIPSELEELEEDWLIISMKDNFMHFEHTSGGNGDTDVVKFEKI